MVAVTNPVTIGGQTVPLGLRVDERLYRGLVNAAKSAGMSTSVYAVLLLNAAHAARSGGTGDVDLEDVVGASLLLWGSGIDTAIIAKTLRITEPEAQQILNTWRDTRRRAMG